jgi:secretion/DNA translocation related TadE-like protein
MIEVARDEGSASIWMLAAGLLVMSFATTVVLAGAATIARHRAQSAADLGALAGAVRVVVDPGGACAAAAAIVMDNGAAMTGCRIDGLDMIVTTSVEVAGAAVGIGPAIGVARAGPIRTAALGATGRGTGQAPVATRSAVGCGDGTVANAASTASSTRTASALESGSLPLPHFGECTHDGQPRSHPQAAMAVRVAVNHSAAT